MKCIIVDDDEMSRMYLSTLCHGIEELEILGVFSNGLECINWLKKNTCDIVFLDIEMPNLSGMDLIKIVENLPQIILTTGHTQYALEAFEHNVTDFLPKPVAMPRLLKSLERVRTLMSGGQTGSTDELFIRVDGRFVRINLDKILYIESLGDYVTFFAEDKKKYIVHSTIKNIAEKITHHDFIKVHRSYVVNLSKVVDIEETNLVIGEKVIPISRAHRPLLMTKIKTL